MMCIEDVIPKNRRVNRTTTPVPGNDNQASDNNSSPLHFFFTNTHQFLKWLVTEEVTHLVIILGIFEGFTKPSRTKSFSGLIKQFHGSFLIAQFGIGGFVAGEVEGAEGDLVDRLFGIVSVVAAHLKSAALEQDHIVRRRDG